MVTKPVRFSSQNTFRTTKLLRKEPDTRFPRRLASSSAAKIPHTPKTPTIPFPHPHIPTYERDSHILVIKRRISTGENGQPFICLSFHLLKFVIRRGRGYFQGCILRWTRDDHGGFSNTSWPIPICLSCCTKNTGAFIQLCTVVQGN